VVIAVAVGTERLMMEPVAQAPFIAKTAILIRWRQGIFSPRKERDCKWIPFFMGDLNYLFVQLLIKIELS